MSEISPNVWQQIRTFLQAHPSVGVIFLIVPLLPVLSNVLDDDDPIGPILWSLIIVVALPALFNVVRVVIDSFQVEKRLRQALVWCFGLCFGVLMLAGTAFLCLVLYQYVMPGGFELRADTPITDAERVAAADRPGPAPGLISNVLPETVDTVELPPQRTELELTPEDSADAPPLTQGPTVAPTVATDAYDRCVQIYFDRGNAEGILSCTALLEG